MIQKKKRRKVRRFFRVNEQLNCVHKLSRNHLSSAFRNHQNLSIASPHLPFPLPLVIEITYQLLKFRRPLSKPTKHPPTPSKPKISPKPPITLFPPFPYPPLALTPFPPINPSPKNPLKKQKTAANGPIKGQCNHTYRTNDDAGNLPVAQRAGGASCVSGKEVACGVSGCGGHCRRAGFVCLFASWLGKAGGESDGD